MKKILVAGFIVAAFISGCGEASQKHAEDAKEDIKEAIVDANQEAKLKTIENWQKFKNDSGNEITSMENQIKEYKEKITKANNKEKAKLNKELDKLEQKLKEQKEKLKQRNAEFETDITKFDESIVTKNESFKREFKHDMSELGAALKDLFKDNVK